VMVLRNIAIIGSNIDAYVCAHQILDNNNNNTITLIDESAEAGFGEVPPGLFFKWPLISENWHSGFVQETPNQSCSAIHHSLFLKSIATSLSNRNATILLRTRVTKISRDLITFEGGGPISNLTESFDEIFDFRKVPKTQKWEGGISTNIIEDNFEIIGTRVDGTIEVWWQGEERNELRWLQRMSWYCKDPRYALEDMIVNGIKTANTIKY